MSIKIKKQQAGTYITEEFSFEAKTCGCSYDDIEGTKTCTMTAIIELDSECYYFGNGTAWNIRLNSGDDSSFFMYTNNNVHRTLKDAKAYINDLVAKGATHYMDWSISA